jgi:hypothetical protein
MTGARRQRQDMTALTADEVRVLRTLAARGGIRSLTATLGVNRTTVEALLGGGVCLTSTVERVRAGMAAANQGAES